MNISHRFKNSVAILLVAAMFLLCPLFWEVYAEENNGSAEIVILIDTSGSMNWADPANNDGTRITTEAVKSFAFLRPSFTDTHISLVVYNQFVKTALTKTNVKTEWGITEYINAVDKINKDQIADFKCWAYTTDIGAALQESYQILSKSTASKKAVLLFTDGRIELGRGESIDKSVQMSNDARDKFAEIGIPIYTIGLNADGSVDKNYLEDLSLRTNGKTVIALSAGELIEHFLEIYANLFEIVPPVINTAEPIPPSGILTHTFNIYGQAVKEVNIMFISESVGSVIETVKVITPTGVEIMNDTNKCVLDESAMISNVKLIDPMDGDWKIELIGNPGDIVKISEISLYDLSLKTTVQDNKINLNYGEILDFDVFLRNNDKNIDILTTQIYADSQSKTYIEIIDPRGVSSLYPGILNESSTGFSFNLLFDRPGNYTIKAFLANDRLSAESEAIIVTVQEPALLLESNGAQFLMCDDAVIIIGLVNNQGEKIDVPDYLKSIQGTLTVHSGDISGDIIETVPFDTNSMSKNNMFEHEFKPPNSGKYTFTAFFQGGGNASESISLAFTNPEMRSNFPDSIAHTIQSGDNGLIYNLSEYFETECSCGLKFKFENIKNPDILAADISGNTLTLSFLNKGETEFEIIAFNDHGTEYRHITKINIKSFTDTVIVIIIAAAAITVLSAAALLFVQSKKKIGSRFRLTLATVKDGRHVSRTDIIPTLKNQKGFSKATKINLEKIITDGRWLKKPPNDDGIDVNEFTKLASKITLSGKPFNKKDIVAKHKNQKPKTIPGTATFKEEDKTITLSPPN